MLVGYYSSVVNTVVVSARHPRYVPVATVLNDAVNYVFEDNRFDVEGDSIKLGGLVSGLLCSYVNVEDTDEKDPFGRVLRRTEAHYIPDYEIVLDPSSSKDDYSDAEYMHRFKWWTADKVRNEFGAKALDKLDSYYNFLNVDEADFEFNYGYEYTGYFKVFDNYLIVHTVLVDSKGKRWSVFWSGDTILDKQEITYKEVKWPYRVQRLHSSNRTEYYGIFRDIVEAQKSLNQAVLKIQLMVNSEKAYVEDNAVDSMDDFTIAFNRVNAVIPVRSLAGIKVENLSTEVRDQYYIIDNALDRIQRVFGINDSFLGMAFASDSGRKVKLQQGQTVMSLRYITARIESFYHSLGMDIANLIKQYYTANQILAVTDLVSGQRFVELNKPMLKYSGVTDEMGQPIMEPILLPVTDPATGDVAQDGEGNFILAPVPEEETEVAFADVHIKVESSSYNDEDEKSQLLLETVISGNIGSLLSQVNPAGFFKMASLAMRSVKTKHSANIVQVLEETAAMLGGNPQAQQQASMMAQGGMGQQPLSRELKLPQNTNEGPV